ncbi:putative ribonuclease H-like domain-containing protein [Tanacetum coccineum]
MKAVKEKEQLQKTLDSWKDSSKNLWRLIDSGMSSNIEDLVGKHLWSTLLRLIQKLVNPNEMSSWQKVWNNANKVNHANKVVIDSVQLNAGRPNFNYVRPNINTGRTNINSVRPKVNAVSPQVNTVRPRQPKKHGRIGGIFDMACSGHMTGDKNQLEDLKNLMGICFLWKTPKSNASEEKDKDVELIVVPLTVRNTEGKAESRKSSTNSKTELQQEKKAFSTDTLEDNPKIQAYRRELEQLALKHLGTVPEKNSTSTPSLIWLFLAFASFMGFIVYQMDVKSAFLYGTIDEEVYVSQPPSFVDPDHPTKVYKVVKALYGLHQAPKFGLLIYLTFLVKHGYKRAQLTWTLFIKRTKTDIMMVHVYVDDIIFWFLHNKSWCDEFEALMKSRFQMSSMGELTFFLGLQVKQNKGGIFISQDKYVAEILKKFDLVNVESCNNTHGDQGASGQWMRKLLMIRCKLQRLLISMMSSGSSSISKGRSNLGLLVILGTITPFDLEAFSDSDYGGSNLDRKSTTGQEHDAVDQSQPSSSTPPVPSTSTPPVPFFTRCIRIDSLETDLKQTKLTMGNAIVKLVKKVKKLEGFLKRRNIVVSDSEEEKPEAQGRKSQDDPLASLVQGLGYSFSTKRIKLSTVSEQLSTGSEQVSTISAKKSKSTPSPDKGQREGKAPMISEETPKKSKE